MSFTHSSAMLRHFRARASLTALYIFREPWSLRAIAATPSSDNTRNGPSAVDSALLRAVKSDDAVLLQLDPAVRITCVLGATPNPADPFHFSFPISATT